VEAPRS